MGRLFRILAIHPTAEPRTPFTDLNELTLRKRYGITQIDVNEARAAAKLFRSQKGQRQFTPDELALIAHANMEARNWVEAHNQRNRVESGASGVGGAVQGKFFPRIDGAKQVMETAMRIDPQARQQFSRRG